VQLTLTHNVGTSIRFLDRLSSQFPFAAAKALTQTARDIANAMPAEVNRVFEGGAVRFTKQAFEVKRAEKTDLTAMVKIKPRQAEYLAYQIEGGSRFPKRKAQRFPGAIDLTPEGNLPFGTIRRLIAAARSKRKIKGRTAKRVGVANGSEIFYGKPLGGDRPVGLYSRRNKLGQRSLVPLVVFPKQAAKYKPKFDFFGVSRKIADRRFMLNYEVAFRQAMETAR
jgi:hypothetical protein